MVTLPKRLKRNLPRSLYGRALLILVLPIVVLQIVVSTALVNRYYDGVTRQMAGDVARELDYVVTAIDRRPDAGAARLFIEAVERPLGFPLRLDEGGSVEPQALRRFYDVTGTTVAETLKSGISRPMTLDLVTVEKSAVLRILTGYGVLEATVPRTQVSPANPHQLLVLTNLAAAALVVIAVLFLRNQVRPIRELAQAAQAFGHGRRVPFRPTGAEEVRRAGHAFLDMRSRIERQVEARTAMLSGVSHDLKTPLTRMKLALAMQPETEDTKALRIDVDEMERMLESFLAFARGEAGEEAVPVCARTLAEEVVEEAGRLGLGIRLETAIDPGGDGETVLRRQAIKRALTNLVNNALTYGRRAIVTLHQSRRALEFIVEDDGPGIPVVRRAEMMRPFTRLDPARGQSRGAGVGLGLSIAQDIARRHGGDLMLGNSAALGGLRATL
ncbi:MAG: ATP-binding protein, partial [Pseudomonadota bacterium]